MIQTQKTPYSPCVFARTVCVCAHCVCLCALCVCCVCTLCVCAVCVYALCVCVLCVGVYHQQQQASVCKYRLVHYMAFAVRSKMPLGVHFKWPWGLLITQWSRCSCLSAFLIFSEFPELLKVKYCGQNKNHNQTEALNSNKDMHICVHLQYPLLHVHVTGIITGMLWFLFITHFGLHLLNNSGTLNLVNRLEY